MRARVTGASREEQRGLLLRFEVRALLTPSSACDPWLPLALGITSAFLQFVFALPACKFPQTFGSDRTFLFSVSGIAATDAVGILWKTDRLNTPLAAYYDEGTIELCY
jgi:hypothetical protein